MADVQGGVVDEVGELHGGVGKRLAHQRAIDDVAQAEGLVLVDDFIELHIALVHAAVIGDKHQQQAHRGQRHDLAVLDARDLEIGQLDDGRLLRHLRQ